MWLQKLKTTKVRSVIQWPASSQPWAGPQPHEPEHPPNLLTQNAWVREGWLFPSVSTQSTDSRVATQRTHPSHAVCGEVSKEGGTVGERHEVSSKTEGPETLRALRREGTPPGFTAQRPGSGPLPAQRAIFLGLASPTPCHHPTFQLCGPIIAHALQIPHLSPGMMRADPM